MREIPLSETWVLFHCVYRKIENFIWHIFTLITMPPNFFHLHEELGYKSALGNFVSLGRYLRTFVFVKFSVIQKWNLLLIFKLSNLSNLKKHSILINWTILIFLWWMRHDMHFVCISCFSLSMCPVMFNIFLPASKQ